METRSQSGQILTEVILCCLIFGSIFLVIGHLLFTVENRTREVKIHSGDKHARFNR